MHCYLFVDVFICGWRGGKKNKKAAQKAGKQE